MLTSVVFKLRSPSQLTLPAGLGRASQALLLRLIDQRSPAEAEALHTGNAIRPYTVSNLVMGKRVNGMLQLSPAATGWLRFTGLTANLSEHLLAIAANPPATVELDGATLLVEEATGDGDDHPWAGTISYQDLAAPFLLGKINASRYLEFEFVSPTGFRSNNHSVPLPIPEMVFGSLLDRWQTFSPIAFNPELRRFAAEMVGLSHYDLHTQGIPLKGGATQIGFVGQVMFTAFNNDRYWLNVLHTLAAYAFYSGLGYQTGAGFGQARAITTGG